ncbi:hypothetical protein AQ938_06940 [Burkholderia pseudomallei]|uniref:DUF6582 domain-containing protein n=1 Tax=Burkholderia pseudomallei TaxID=28450 RepID=UPI00015F7D19|nr:DUF6582 domain-containing protein [Burkholderia pseudomallei]AJX62041.1 hypothetical protein DP47_3378 [Burkholderia pseudomallei Pasteur 52237]EDO95567.1 hypothetical protein BURPSPAST_C1342 [Burkholderia pseudomallei Pasteur 52237]MWA16582.1 hypothetical protein [Burkholderia pseudomallei]OND79008.1 hypothetical protein AQ938_06940 [Burkholderia pseudomallei]VBQ80945.1 Uncharacterised protein [Burkholderia pseudomallei]
MAKLTTAERARLPADAFAVPGKRELPIRDRDHVREAWDMVDRTQGLTPDERRTARERIKRRAHQIGMSTKGWKADVSASVEICAQYELAAMSIAVPDPDHPNKMPFTGVLTRVDEPSDNPPGGSDGHRTFIPAEVAEAALGSLLGMCVDFTPNFDGHDKTAKIGLITEAYIDGSALRIGGFFYANDFPNETAEIKAKKDRLGFSYEAKAAIRDVNAETWHVDRIVFTGAAVLLKDKAAYTTTSLEAARANQEPTMEELKQLMEAVGALTTKVTEIAASQAATSEAVSKLNEKAIEAAAARDKVRPHAESLRSCAASMEAAGIGTHSTSGHANVLRHMAASMEAEAAMGNIPHIYRDHDYLSRVMEAGAAGAAGAGAAVGADKGAKADDATAKQIAELAASVASMTTVVTDLKAAAFNGAREPERKTLSPEMKTLLAKAGLTDQAEKGTLTVSEVDKTLEAAGITGHAAMTAKLKLMHSGILPVGKQ